MVPGKDAERSTVINQAEQVKLEIRTTAQILYEERRALRDGGDELSDWLEAERIVREEYNHAIGTGEFRSK